LAAHSRMAFLPRHRFFFFPGQRVGLVGPLKGENIFRFSDPVALRRRGCRPPLLRILPLLNGFFGSSHQKSGPGVAPFRQENYPFTSIFSRGTFLLGEFGFKKLRFFLRATPGRSLLGYSPPKYSLRRWIYPHLTFLLSPLPFPPSVPFFFLFSFGPGV